MVCIIMTRPCLFSQNTNADIFQRKKGKFPSLPLCDATTYLICQHCNQAACATCVKEIYHAIPRKDRESDRWCKFVCSHIQKLEVENVMIQIGHCCESKLEEAKQIDVTITINNCSIYHYALSYSIINNDLSVYNITPILWLCTTLH